MSGKVQKRERQKQLKRQRVEAEIRAYKARRRRSLLIRLGLVLGLIGAVAGVALAQRSGNQPTAEDKPCSEKKPERPEIAPVTGPPPMTIDPAKTYTATLETSCGTMTITLADETSPQTVNSFVFLARQQFFDGLTFHRITPFAIQGGDPQGDGTGGPGYKVVDTPPAEQKYEKGIVAMAKAGDEPAGTAGSQFFIVPDTENAATLNGLPSRPAQYGVLGRVATGLDTLAKLAAVETFTPQTSQEKSTPRKPVYIVKITIQES